LIAAASLLPPSAIQFDRVFMMDSDTFLLNDADSVFCNVPLLGDAMDVDDVTEYDDVIRLEGHEEHPAVADTSRGQAWRSFGYAAATERRPPSKRVIWCLPPFGLREQILYVMTVEHFYEKGFLKISFVRMTGSELT